MTSDSRIIIRGWVGIAQTQKKTKPKLRFSINQKNQNPKMYNVQNQKNETNWKLQNTWPPKYFE